jgi:hypothetical protein
MKRILILLFAITILVSLTGCAKEATSGHVDHAYISRVAYIKNDGASQVFYLFNYRGLLLQVPLDTNRFNVYVKGNVIMVTNIRINMDGTLSCDWANQ